MGIPRRPFRTSRPEGLSDLFGVPPYSTSCPRLPLAHPTNRAKEGNIPHPETIAFGNADAAKAAFEKAKEEMDECFKEFDELSYAGDSEAS